MKRRKFLQDLVAMIALGATGEILTDKTLAQETFFPKHISEEQARIELEDKNTPMPWILPYACRAGKEYHGEETEGFSEYIDVWKINQDSVHVERWLENKEKGLCSLYKKYNAFHNNRSRGLIKLGISQGSDKYVDSWKLIGEGKDCNVQIERMILKSNPDRCVPLDRWNFNLFKGISRLEESGLNTDKEQMQLAPGEKIYTLPEIRWQQYYENGEKKVYQLPPRTIVRKLR